MQKSSAAKAQWRSFLAVVAFCALRRDVHAVALRIEVGAKLFASLAKISERFGLVVKAAKERLFGVVVAHQTEIALRRRAALVCQFHQKTDPARVPAAEMAGREGEIAQAIEDRLALIHFDRQWIMRSVTDDDVGAGIDRGLGNVGHVLQRLAAKPPVTGGDDDVDLRPQR